MVQLDAVRASNAKVSTLPAGLVGVFVGATGGIGESTAKQFATHAKKPTIYIVGRTESSGERVVSEIKEINPDARAEFVKADVSILKNVDAACEHIKAKESKINLLLMSAGYLTFSGREESGEGLDKVLSLRYYSRIRFASNLLPLLNATPSTEPARVISILAGGKEGQLVEDDLDLKTHYSLVNGMNHTSTMTSLSFNHLTKENPHTSFIHAYPGIVLTSIYGNGMSAPVSFLMRYILKPLLTPFSVSIPECGERQLFHAMSARYPPKSGFAGIPTANGVEIAKGMDGGAGVGPYLLDWNGETGGDSKLFTSFKEKSMEQKVWEHTAGKFPAA